MNSLCKIELKFLKNKSAVECMSNNICILFNHLIYMQKDNFVSIFSTTRLSLLPAKSYIFCFLCPDVSSFSFHTEKTFIFIHFHMFWFTSRHLRLSYLGRLLYQLEIMHYFSILRDPRYVLDILNLENVILSQIS